MGGKCRCSVQQWKQQLTSTRNWWQDTADRRTRRTQWSQTCNLQPYTLELISSVVLFQRRIGIGVPIIVGNQTVFILLHKQFWKREPSSDLLLRLVKGHLSSHRQALLPFLKSKVGRKEPLWVWVRVLTKSGIRESFNLSEIWSRWWSKSTNAVFGYIH